MTEQEAIILQLALMDLSFARAKILIERQKHIGFMTPELAENFRNLFAELAKGMELRAELVELANTKYGMNVE